MLLLLLLQLWHFTVLELSQLGTMLGTITELKQASFPRFARYSFSIPSLWGDYVIVVELLSIHNFKILVWFPRQNRSRSNSEVSSKPQAVKPS